MDPLEHKADLELPKDEPVVVDWPPGDPENPLNWSPRKKYTNVLVPIYICLLTSLNSTSTGIMSFWGPERFGTTRLGFQFSVTSYLIAFSFASLVTAPLSELFGRKLIYQALTTNLGVLLSMRALQGIAASAGNALIGGSIADLFTARDRALSMNLFVLANLVGQGAAGVILGWVGMRAGIAWCYGVQGIALAAGVIMCFALLSETRSDVLLARRAAALTRSTGIPHVRINAHPRSLPAMVRISCVRPIQFMFTEPIVTAICLWLGFNWSCIYLGMSSTLLVFGQYGWSPGWLGMIQFTTIIGGVLGFITSAHQDWLYARACRRSPTGQARPEARLYWAIVGAFVFPAATYVYAWTGRPSVPWPVPALFLTLAFAAISAINYLADAYETYSASAQAAHGFSRSMFAACFPLLTHAMYTNLGYPIASTLVASIALVLAVAPVLIFCYGPKLRAMSKVTTSLTKGAF